MAREEDRPPPGPVDVPFPVGGLYKRAGYQRQPPHTTADCLNVRPFDTLEGRERGGARPGIIKAFTPALGSGNPIQLLAPVSVVATSGAVTRTLVAAANGAVSFSTNGTTFTGVSGTLNSSAPKLQAAEHNQKLYIADYRAVKVSGTNGVIAETNKLSAAGVDWTTLGISTSLDVCLVTGLPDSTYGTGTIGATFGVVTLSGGTWPSWVAGGALVVGGATYYVKTRDSDTQVTLASNLVTIAASSTYQVSKSPDDIFPISAVATGYITLTGTLPNASCSYQIGRRIKVFDATTNTLSSLVHTYGIPPVGCPLMCTYRDRLVLAGPDQVWYMSRSGDPTDFDYGADPNDVQRPVAGTTSDAGSIGEPITALIPHSDDYLILATANSLWALRGDPAFGGQIEALSREVGILSAGAWCKLPDATVVFLSRDGLCAIPAGGASYPVVVSREKLPRELINVDPPNNVISMIYDSRDRGIHLYIAPTAISNGTHWWLDWENKTFWPMQFANQKYQPYTVVSYAPPIVTTFQYVMLGCKDGYVRRYRDTAANDDGIAFSSHVVYGPLRLAAPGDDAIVTLLAADLDATSSPVTWTLRLADTSEGCLPDSAYAAAAGTWRGGRNRPVHPRGRGPAASLKVSGAAMWAIESVMLQVAPGGRLK